MKVQAGFPSTGFIWLVCQYIYIYKDFWGFRFELLMLVCSLPTKSRKRLACNALVIFATHSALVHGSLKAVIHFQSWSHDYMMHDQLLWDTTDHDVIIMTLSGLG